MSSYALSIWKQAPFVRLLPPLIAGIIVQYYLPLPVINSWRLTGISLCGLTLYAMFSARTRFTLSWLTGVCLHLLLFSAGALLTYYKDSSPLARKVSRFCNADEYDNAGHSSYPFMKGAGFDSTGQGQKSFNRKTIISSHIFDSTNQDPKPFNRKKNSTRPVVGLSTAPRDPTSPASISSTKPAAASTPRRPPEIIALIRENPSEKRSSWKMLATIQAIHKHHPSIHPPIGEATLSDAAATIHKQQAPIDSDIPFSSYSKNKQRTTRPDSNAPGNPAPSSIPDKTLNTENRTSPHYPGCSMKNCGKIFVYFLKPRPRPKRITAPSTAISNRGPGAPFPDHSTPNPASPLPDSAAGEMLSAYTVHPYPAAYPRYGNMISFAKPLQPIENFMPPGPGSFDYRRYCAFEGIHFQVFLRPGEFTVLPQTRSSPLQALLIHTREKIISIIQKYIPGKKEQGLAEALLIGYKDDLDKSLLQSYSNTGVVHVIAISGLHLGLIYALLKIICLPLSRMRKNRWPEPLIILAGLWLFSLLAGGAPSVLRSAVMFSFIVLGKSISRETSIYNNLAASAFALLCYHPYWLWDVGFQLSYAALTGIVIFMKPVYRLLTFKNAIADAAWKLNAVTIAAQWLTLPLILFYFRQFPNLFLLTNFIAVPLSSIILIGELLLCAISWLPPAATAIGWALHWMIWAMNTSIQYLEKIPFSTWKDLSISLPQAILLYTIIFYGRGLLSKINTHK